MRNTDIAAVTLLVSLTVTAGAGAQVRVGVEQGSLASLHRRAVQTTPSSGPPGTVVKVFAMDLPVAAPLRVGIGALRFGFEEAGWVLSDYDGEIELDVVIPSWARYDVAHVVIVFDPYFAPLALSKVFHVTDAQGVVQRNGRLTDDGSGCPTLLGEDEVPYALTGDLGGFVVGDVVTVTGPIGESAQCEGRYSIGLRAIRASEN